MPSNAEFLVPGGAFSGPLFNGLLKRLDSGVRELAAGERVGPYRVIEALGRGGMAVVYLAERADGEFEQKVALKLVRPDSNSELTETLFRQERQILAGLQHPHIARLLDGGRSPDGLLWFALEPVDGVRIDLYCRERHLSLSDRLRLFQQVCGAVQFAHSRLLVHRDIKPSNILVNAAGEAKLLDFGIARLLAAADDGGQLADRALTPGFASPEQRRGEAVGVASDIYQLGMLLLCLNEESVLQSTAVPTRTNIIAQHDATDRGTRLAAIGNDDLRAIVQRCLQSEPTQRYATAAELGRDIENLLQRRPVQAHLGGALYRMRRFVQRNVWSVAIGALALAAFAGLAIGFTLRLAAQRDQAQREAGRANAATGFLLDLFSVADPSNSRGDTLTANQILARGADKLNSQLKDQPVLRAELLANVGQVHMGLGQLARAEPMLLEAVALSRNGSDSDPIELARRLRVLAQIQWRQGKYAQALGSTQEAYALVGSRADQIELRAKLLNTQAVCELLLGHLQDAAATQHVALALIEAHLGPDDALLGYGYNNLARIEAQLGHEPEAIAAYERSLANARLRLGDDHPDVYDISTTYAYQLGSVGRFDEAYSVLAQSRKGISKVLGEKDSRYAYTLLVESELKGQQGEHATALILARQSNAVYREALGDDHVLIAVALEVLGHAYRALDRHAEALETYRQTVSIREKLLSEDHIDLATARFHVGRELCEAGQVDAGRDLLQRSLAVDEQQLPAGHAQIAEVRATLSKCVQSSAK